MMDETPGLEPWLALGLTDDQWALIHNYACQPGERECDVYWGSHGCALRQHHPGQCMCDCAWDGSPRFGPGPPTPAVPPYYGPDTVFHGADAAARGLPVVDDYGDGPVHVEITVV